MGATVTQVKNRIATLVANISGITTVQDDWPEDSQPFAPSELPCLIVQAGPVVNSGRISHARFSITREYRILLLVERIEEDIADPDTSALEAVEPYLLSVPAYFAQRPRLEDATNNTGLVFDSSLPTDNGTPRIVREGAVYRGAVFTMTVTTRH